MEPSTQTYNDPQIALQAKNMTKAIFQTESGGDFNAKGKSGEHGAGQWTPPTWKAQAQDVLGNGNAPMTPENQSVVAQGTIRKLIAQGKNAAQIAAIWNSGSDQNWENKVGKNQYGVGYNVPKYVKSVTDAYQTLKQGGSVGVDPNNPSAVGTQYQDPNQSQDQSPSVGGFLGNVVSSGANFLGGIGQAVMHPIQTAENLGKVAIGGVEKLIPGQQGQEQNFDQLAQFYKERYGGLGNIAHTLYTDPVGAAADASVLLGGAGAIAGKVGELGDLGRVADIGSTLSKAGETVNPLNLAGKAVSGVAGLAGKGASEVLGATTGVGAGPIREAFTNPQDVVSTMRGGQGAESVMNTVQQGTEAIKEARGVNYRSALAGLPENSLDISPLTNSLESKLQQYKIATNPSTGELDFSRSPISSAGQADIQEAIQTIKDWGTKTGDRTPEGLHILQQKLGDMIPKTGQARAFITSLKSQLTDVLNKAPGFKEMQAAYAKDSGLIDDINRSLLSNNPETAVNKITSLMKRNKEFKIQVAKQLEEATGQKIIGKVAGLQLNQLQPSGLTGRLLGTAELGAGAFVNPKALFGLLAASPRLVGEITRYLGMGKLKANSIMNALQKAKVPQAALIGQRINYGLGQTNSK